MKQVAPGNIRGKLRAPSSKSVMQRAVAAAALAHGRSEILFPSYSDDGRAALRVAQALGANIEELTDRVLIEGGGELRDNTFDCGESGLSFRLFSAIAAIFGKDITLTARGTLLNRPMDMVIDALTKRGVRVQSTSGKPPLYIRGPLKGGHIEVDGSVSSQFVSGLLMALALCNEDSILSVRNLVSSDYVLLTVDVVKRFGVEIEMRDNGHTFYIRGQQVFKPCRYEVEGDWSGASFFLVAAAISGRIDVEGLRSDSKQADRRILAALKSAGALVQVSDEFVRVEKRALQAFEFDARDCPDLFPPLVALASYCRGKSTIYGVHRLFHKESNRAEALKKEFGALGVPVVLEGDAMLVHAASVKGGEISSHGDHRIAMACAIAALGADCAVQIKEPHVVAKSYQHFFKDLDQVRSMA